MRHVDSRKLRMQTAGVVALIALVGWPRYRPLPEVTVWRAQGPATPAPQLDLQDPRIAAGQDLPRPGRRGQSRFGTDTTATQAAQGQNRALQNGLSGTTNDDGTQTQRRADGSTAIIGHAVTDSGQKVPYARLLLRNLITGKIEARVVADQNGTFTFDDVNASGYVVEMVAPDGSLIATSNLVRPENGGPPQIATIRISSNSTVRAIFGNVLTAPTAPETVNQAILAGTQNVTQPSATNSPQL